MPTIKVHKTQDPKLKDRTKTTLPLNQKNNLVAKSNPHQNNPYISHRKTTIEQSQNLIQQSQNKKTKNLKTEHQSPPKSCKEFRRWRERSKEVTNLTEWYESVK